MWVSADGGYGGYDSNVNFAVRRREEERFCTAAPPAAAPPLTPRPRFAPPCQSTLQIFVSVTTILITPVFLFLLYTGRAATRSAALLKLALSIVYWVFWLSAAAALSSTTSWANSGWNTGFDCDVEDVGATGTALGDALAAAARGAGNYYCDVADALPALRAACAFAWFTFFFWTASLVLAVMEDAKHLKSGGAAAAAPADAAAPPGAAKVASAKAAAPPAAAPPAADAV